MRRKKSSSSSIKWSLNLRTMSGKTSGNAPYECTKNWTTTVTTFSRKWLTQKHSKPSGSGGGSLETSPSETGQENHPALAVAAQLVQQSDIQTHREGLRAFRKGMVTKMFYAYALDENEW